MHHSSLITSLFAVLLGTTLATSAHPVCIVGAGPSGLMAASKLEAKGKQVVLFDKQTTVGGKCQSYYDSAGNFFSVGALMFSNTTYVQTLKLIDTLGVPVGLFETGEAWVFNYTTGAEAPRAPPSQAFKSLVVAEYQRYVELWTNKWAQYSVAGFKNGVPAEFSVTTAEWLAANNFQALPVLFIRSMAAFGYGDFRQVPIIYVLNYLTPDILGYFLGLNMFNSIDFHELFVRFAKTIKGPIHLGSNITKIDRTGSNPSITYRNPENVEPITQQCSSLILAFPQTINTLKAANLELSSEETAVFTPVTLIEYYAAAVDIPEVPFGYGFSVDTDTPLTPPPAYGGPTAWVRPIKESSIASVWCWGDGQGATAAYEILKSTLSKLNRDVRVEGSVPKPVGDEDVKMFVAPDYFPHYGAEALKAGVYDRFNALQGKQATYYVSALNGFELVEYVLRGAVDLVETYF